MAQERQQFWLETLGPHKVGKNVKSAHIGMTDKDDE